ncbi:hypothetical protein H5410_058592 [Solanum commersonii]|uniref:Uncharacterized protein n=1 Tax=Solanum commersonii TaxID=4109 RepID=A0A9J5WS08_SOLCO|nr:hypothetical protein H5410_058592 [Solanum commersonii]
MVISGKLLMALMMSMGFGFGESEWGGTSLLDFAKAFELVIANSCFRRRRTTRYLSELRVAKTRIDYFLLGRVIEA